MGYKTVESTPGGCPLDYERYGNGPFPICGVQATQEGSRWFVRIQQAKTIDHPHLSPLSPALKNQQ